MVPTRRRDESPSVCLLWPNMAFNLFTDGSSIEPYSSLNSVRLSGRSFSFVVPKHKYGKCPKILYAEVSDKLAFADSADPDQTAPRSSLIRAYTVCLSIVYLRKQLLKKAKFRPK